jgi:uncharacterized hydrophobic protein (TIGR00341 family)
MSLRLVELAIPNEDLSKLEIYLKEHDITNVWVGATDRRDVVRVLVSAERTEAVTDLLQQLYGAKPGFRLLLLPVEATLPFLEEKPHVTKEAGAAAHQKPEVKTPQRISREELYQDVAGGMELSTTYIVTLLLSTLVAAIGLMRGLVAAVIGAMVIAPLLRPNIGLALATTLGDISLAVKSIKTLLLGFVLIAGLSVILGLTMPVDPSVPEIAARTNVGLSDVLLGVAAGVAGALAFTTGLPTSLIGVMVAVALLPPLVAAGLLLGSGHHHLAIRAAVLLATNVACVNLAGVVTFLAKGVRPRSWWDEKKARKASRLAVGFWLIMVLILIFLIVFLWR